MAVTFFVATDNQATKLGTELWQTDGTAAGTKMVTDINTGPGSSNPANFVLNSTATTMFFTADDGVHGTELWAADTTTGATTRMDRLPAASTADYKSLVVVPLSIVNSGTRMLFVATDNQATALGTELWSTDGTAAGTKMVSDINTGTGSSNPANFLFNTGTGKAYFTATDGTHGTELWVYDPTTNTSTRLDRLPAASTADYSSVVASSITRVAARVIFVATDNQATATGTELWSTDGTAAGTSRVSDLNPGAGSSNPANFVTNGGSLAYFTATDGVHGVQLYVYDSSANTSTRLDRLPSAGTADYKTVIPSTVTLTNNGNVIFVATDNQATATGTELWMTDGTAAGTRRLAEINPGAGSSTPSNLVNDNNGRVYFTADDGTHGAEVWLYNNTDNSLTRLDRLPSASTADYKNVVANSIDVISNKVIFVATDNQATATGTELYVSDRTAAGTRRAADINVGPGSSNPTNFVNVGQTTFFIADDGTHGAEVWRYDATTDAVTRMDRLPSASTADYKNVVAGSLTPTTTTRLLFVATDNQATAVGQELWSTDGTAAGTTRVSDINPGAAGSAITNIRIVNNQTLFTATDGVHGNEEWRYNDDNTVTRLDALSSASTAAYTSPALPARLTYTLRATDAVKLGTTAGQIAYTFTVSRSGDLSVLNNVSYSVTGSGTNAATASNFVGGVLPSGTISFTSSGQISKTITVNVVGDPSLTQSLGFTVTIGQPTNDSNITGQVAFDTATALGAIQSPIPVITPTTTQATVSGAGGVPFAMNFSSAALATQGRAQIAALGASTQAAASSSAGALPAVATGQVGVANIDSSGLVTMPGGYGAAIITASGPVSLISAAAGDQMVVASGAGDLLYSAVSGTETIYAGSGKSTLFGNSSSLNIFGGDGASSIIGGTGVNTVTGGSGQILMFGTNKAVYTGGAGAATVIGGTGGLTANMGPGGGIVFGTPGGGYTLSSGTGNATLVGGGEGDVVTSTGPGSNALIAAGGAETLNAATATGPNVFFGGSGADVMIGGSGNDLFLAGSANETLTGGAGNNTYVFNAVTGGTTRADTITDFNTNNNGIFLFGYGTAASANAAALASQKVVGGVTQITLTDGTQINFTGAPTLKSFNFFT